MIFRRASTFFCCATFAANGNPQQHLAPDNDSRRVALHRAIESMPDKHEKFGTTSHRFKKDLVDFFSGISATSTVLEIGRFEGHTTAILRSVFRRVLSVDLSPSTVGIAEVRYEQFLQIGGPSSLYPENVVFISADIYSDPWASFTYGNNVVVAVIDAVHSFEAVSSDIWNAMKNCGSTLRWLVFDDWGMPEILKDEFFGVRRAAEAFIASGHLRCSKDIGYAAGTNVGGLVELEASEGQICEVLWPEHSLVGSTSHRNFLGLRLNGMPAVQGSLATGVTAAQWSNVTKWWLYRVRMDKTAGQIDWSNSYEQGWLRLHPQSEGGWVISSRHGSGHYRFHPELSNKEFDGRTTLVLRYGLRSFKSSGRPKLQVLLVVKDDWLSFVMSCFQQPGKFDAQDAKRFPECRQDSMHGAQGGEKLIGFREQLFTSQMSKVVLTD